MKIRIFALKYRQICVFFYYIVRFVNQILLKQYNTNNKLD